MLLNKERAYRIMEKYEVEAIIAAMPENVTYLTDFWSLSHWILKGTPTFAVLPRDRKIEPFIATPISELDQAAMGEGTGVKDFSTFGTFYVEVPEEAILAEEERKLKNLLNRLLDILRCLRIRQHHMTVPGNDRQEIVEVVGDATG